MPSSTSHDTITFAGLLAPILTPFGADGTVDHAAFTALAKALLANGCTGLAPFGTTSEATSLGIAERKAGLEALVDAGIDPAMLMPGTGTCAVADTLDLCAHAHGLGVRACLLLPPFYYKNVSDAGLEAYFAQVLEQLPGGFAAYLYHIPQMSHVGLSVELVARLAERFPSEVRGVKDSSGDWDNTSALIAQCPHLEIFSGAELSLLDNLKAGGAGCISATANLNPTGIRAIIDAHRAGDAAGAASAQETASTIRRIVQKQPVIPLLKGMLSQARHQPHLAAVRAPLVALDPAVVTAMADELRAHGVQQVS
ncbi:MAG: dihydrodipicolinate synthase family protein [Pseudomonadota bacterium]